MNKLLTFVLAAIAVTFLGVVIFVIYRGGVVPDKIGVPVEQLEYREKDADTAVIYAIGVDLEANNDISDRSIVLGEDGFLLIRSKATEDKPSEIYTFNGLLSLASYDLNLDGRIDQADPIYDAILLATLHPRKKVVRYISMSKAGIHALLLHRSYLHLARIGEPSRFLQQASTAVFADGSRRLVRVVPLHIKHFQNVSLVETN